MPTHKSFSSQETEEYASEILARVLEAPEEGHARIVALEGELGSGKTTFVRGFLRALGVRKKVTSPTFVLIKRYENVYHIDAYRVADPEELDVLGLKEILSAPSHIVLIEWADRVKELVPEGALWLRFEHGEQEHERTITEI